MALSLKQEADRIEDMARVNRPEALASLNALLDRPRRLDGHDKETAMSFNARLVTELRRRIPSLLSTYYPPHNPNGQQLPTA